MRTITKTISAIALVLAISFCVNTSLKAQTPADDPGIGGPGSPGNGPQGDGGPVVPFDGGMSLMLAVSGVVYGAKKVKQRRPVAFV